ncbi:FGGY family carbohydrate kinase [Paenibacillus sp. FSL R7-0337]|uniref:sedoheptulokinase n=1 Tax=Paenibacillus sp. FSL R7-0337 TaxID=1926588 RepID=UPI0015C37BED|nr:FGGY family carbohydrate kinase [Paenibacillus sp. FSL R7-0337]
MEPMITAGLDIGTTSISGLLYDLEKRTILHSLTEAQASLPFSLNQEWEQLQDPELIMKQVERIVERLLAHQPEVTGIGLTGQMHGIVYLDKSGRAIGPLYTWQDGRAGQLTGGAGSPTYAQQFSDLTGYTVAPGFGLATHYYNVCRQLVPERAVGFCTIADYIAMRLANGDIPLIDATQAAGIGGFSLRTGDFDRTAIHLAGIEPAFLPQVVSSGTAIGSTSQGIPVYTSFGDNQASFLGSVPQLGDSLLLNIGTGSQLSAWVPVCDNAPSAMEVRPFPGGGVLMVGAALSGGKSYALLEGFFRQVITAYTGEAPADVYSLMSRLLSEQVPGSGSTALTVNTQFLGTRTAPEKRGSVKGITLENFTPGGLAHAFLQGMVDELHGFLTEMEPQGANTFTRLIGSGNALRTNPVLCAKAEAAFGLSLELGEHAEEAAVGAALCAAVGSGEITSFSEAGAYLRAEPS